LHRARVIVALGRAPKPTALKVAVVTNHLVCHPTLAAYLSMVNPPTIKLLLEVGVTVVGGVETSIFA